MNTRAQITAGFSSAPVFGGASNALKINRFYTLYEIPGQARDDVVRDDAFVPVMLSSTQHLRHAGQRHAELDSASHPRVISTIKIHNIMKKELSGDYLAPEIEVVELKARSVLCQSGDIPGLTNDDTSYTF